MADFPRSGHTKIAIANKHLCTYVHMYIPQIIKFKSVYAYIMQKLCNYVAMRKLYEQFQVHYW